MPGVVSATQPQGWLDVQPSTGWTEPCRGSTCRQSFPKLSHHSKPRVSMKINWFLLLFKELMGKSSLSVFMEMFPQPQWVETVTITLTHRYQHCKNQVSFLDPWVVGSFLSCLSSYPLFLFLSSP